jgi:hypothetical protein
MSVCIGQRRQQAKRRYMGYSPGYRCLQVEKSREEEKHALSEWKSDYASGDEGDGENVAATCTGKNDD